ncbi:hypothetical protein P3T20_006949 [Paraburkholderia sp. GAS206C]
MHAGPLCKRLLGEAQFNVSSPNIAGEDGTQAAL